MDQFITWEMLGDYVKLTGIVLGATQFIKNLPGIRKMPTQYLSWLVAFILITITHINLNTFAAWDLVLYALSAMFIGTSASGIYDAGDAGSDKVEKIANAVKELLTKEDEPIEGIGSVVEPDEGDKE